MSYPFDCITDFIFVETDVKKSDVILVPGGTVPELMERAAELYHKGFAPYILPSGGPNYRIPEYESEWEYLKSIGIKLGIPEKAILKEDKAKHTFDNANLSWKVLRGNNINVKKAILACKGYHSRRALLTYKTAFPLDIEFYVSPVLDRRKTTKDNWFLDGEKISLVMGEVSKIGGYFEGEISKWVSCKD
ncbi:hypothetical protein HMPREF1982_00486 [Clostridiales bacterium oral taxon 876 str. F0540]|nr:hypothetical protein HMPREF1982_00486 [Clostridiales bacterium oral taxon 876 str. F0540]